MVATYPAKRRIEPGRVVAADFHPSGAEMIPERTRSLSQSTEPVVNDSHTHAFACFCSECIGKHPPCFVFVNDVAFEVDVTLSRLDRIEPRRIVLLSVFQKSNAIAGYEWRAGGTREGLVCQVPHGDHRIFLSLITLSGAGHG